MKALIAALPPARRDRLVGLALIAPLALYLLVFMIGPFATLMQRSVYDDSVARTLPQTVAKLQQWSGEGPVPDAAAIALVREGSATFRARSFGPAADRLDFERVGTGSSFVATMRLIDSNARRPASQRELAALDPMWAETGSWTAIKRAGHTFTPAYFLRAVDLHISDDGQIVGNADGSTPHRSLLWRTLWLAALITLITLILAFPLAAFVARQPRRRREWLVGLVVLSLWLSLMVRASAWIVLLQSSGVINDLLVGVGLIANEARLQMAFNQIGLLIAMTHFLLPFMVLPILTALGSVPKSLMRAAVSLGASPLMAFLRVLLPAIAPGLAVAILFGFILSLGFYIIPALLGGASGQMASGLIALYMTQTLDVGLGSALGILLMIPVIAIYPLYARMARRANVSLGSGADIALDPSPAPSVVRPSAQRWGNRLVALLGVFTLAFLVAPVLVIIPLSLSSSSFLSFTPEMLGSSGWSLKWYAQLLVDERWITSLINSTLIALLATAASLILGGLAALGLARPNTPGREAARALFLLPMVAPIILLATGSYLMFSWMGIVGNLTAVILAHIAIIAPAVVFQVSPALGGALDLGRAAHSLGAGPLRTFLKVTLPIAAPGFLAGGLLAFLGSFDESVVIQFLVFSPDQFTLPRQLFSGLRDEVTPTILAAGTSITIIFIIVYAISVLVGRRGSC